MKVLASVLFLSLFALIYFKVNTITVRTEEMFPVSSMQIIDIGGYQAGVIHSDFSTLLMVGKDNQGKIIQIAGTHIDNYGNADPVPYKMVWSGNTFRGWIMFRTHARKFCGGDHIPSSCMLK